MTPSARVIDVHRRIEVNLANRVHHLVAEPGERIVEIRVYESTAMLHLWTKADGTLVVHLYDTAGPVHVQVIDKEVPT